MKLLIKNGTVIDPANNINDKCDVLVEDGLVKKIDKSIDENADSVIDATGLTVMPGFIDLHVHFRDPGFTHKETIKTGSMAAAAGGVTSACTMPNTKPATDSPELIKYAIDKGNEYGYTHVLPLSAVTKGQEGKELVDIEAVKAAGACALSEDGKSVMDINVYREAIKKAAELDMLIMAHCEDKNLVNGGVITEGVKSKELGLPGICNSVEDVITARDIFLCGEAGARLHLCHCSTKGTVELVKMARNLGFSVTAEVCPHHFALCDEDIPGDDAMFKMNPPLRSRADMEAMIKGLADGTMEVISTDHAPHAMDEKAKGFMGAPFGIVGIENSFALSYTELVKKGHITIDELVRKMSTNPARILKIDKGNLAEGKVADIVIADLNDEYEINPADFYSMGKNTPFTGKKVNGRIKYTIVDGKVVFPFA